MSQSVGLDDKEKSLKKKYEEIDRKLEKEKQVKEEENKQKLEDAKKLFSKNLDTSSTQENKVSGFKRPTIHKTSSSSSVVSPTSNISSGSSGKSGYNSFEDGEYEEQTIVSGSVIPNTNRINSGNNSGGYSSGGYLQQQQQQQPLQQQPYQQQQQQQHGAYGYNNHSYSGRFNAPSHQPHHSLYGGPPPHINTPPQQNAIFVGDLLPTIREDQLTQVFRACGEISSIKLFPQRGFAFVNYKDRESVNKAIMELNGVSIDGNPIKVGPSSSRVAQLGRQQTNRYSPYPSPQNYGGYGPQATAVAAPGYGYDVNNGVGGYNPYQHTTPPPQQMYSYQQQQPPLQHQQQPPLQQQKPSSYYNASPDADLQHSSSSSSPGGSSISTTQQDDLTSSTSHTTTSSSNNNTNTNTNNNEQTQLSESNENDKNGNEGLSSPTTSPSPPSRSIPKYDYDE